MVKFRKISTEFWLLIDIRNWFSLSFFVMFLPIFFKLGIRVDIGRSILGLQMGKYRQISTELWPLIDVRN